MSFGDTYESGTVAGDGGDPAIGIALSNDPPEPVGAEAEAGESSEGARADHVHEAVAPTPEVDDDSTSIATTAYVQGQLSDDPPEPNGTASAGTSKKIARAEHVHPRDLEPAYASVAAARAERLGQPQYGGINVIAIPEMPLPSFVNFTRAGKAWAWGPNGDLREFAENEPRHAYDPVTRRYLGGYWLSRVSRTNVLLWSNDQTQSAWTKANCTASYPDLTVRGFPVTRLTASAGNHGVSTIQSATKSAAAQTWTGWAIVRTSGMPYIHFWIDGGSSTNRSRAIFQVSDWSLLTLNDAGTFTGGVAKAVDLGGGIALIRVTATTGTESAIRMVIVPSSTSLSTVGTYDGDEYLDPLHCQLEQSPFATTPILTEGSAVTVPGEVMNCPVPTHLWSSTALTMVWRGRVFALPSAAVATLMGVDDGTSNNRTGIRLSQAGAFLLNVVSEGVTGASVSGGSAVLGEETALSARIYSDDFAFSRDGGSVATDTSGAVPIGMTPTIKLGYETTGAWTAYEHVISQFALFPVAAPDADVQALSRLAPP